MSVLTLVRHAQASFSAADYDRLSELGQAQAALLGEYWTRRPQRFDEVYTGPRTRQRHTAELAGACYQRAGLAWPEPTVLAELDEYDLDGLVHRLAPELARQNQEFGTLVDRYRRAEEKSPRAFQQLFEMLLQHWLTMPEGMAGLESWSAFRARVRRCLDHMMNRPGRRRQVAVFTSGGFIGTAVQLALVVPDRAALELSWRIRNCSLCEFVFSGGRFTLDSFNTLPHLPDAASWTYR